MSNSKTIIVNNCEFRWAKLAKPVNPFGSGDAYEVQIVTNDEMVANVWANQNLLVKSKETPEGKEYYVNLKRWAKSPTSGKEYDAPSVVNSAKEPIDPAIVGNGSKGKIKVYQYEWTKGGRSGIATIFVALQVTDLVEYNPEATVDF